MSGAGSRKGEGRGRAYLEHAALYGDLDLVDGDAREVVDLVLEREGRLGRVKGVEGVRLARMLERQCKRGHGCARWCDYSRRVGRVREVESVASSARVDRRRDVNLSTESKCSGTWTGVSVTA